MTRPLQDAWVELLKDVPFQYFTTATFDRLRRLHPEAVHKKMRLYSNRANDILFGPGWLTKHGGIGSLIALEPHKDDRTHVHLLQYHPELCKDDVATRMLLKNLWEAGPWAHEMSLREGIARCLPAADDAARQGAEDDDSDRDEALMTETDEAGADAPSAVDEDWEDESVDWVEREDDASRTGSPALLEADEPVLEADEPTLETDEPTSLEADRGDPPTL